VLDGDALDWLTGDAELVLVSALILLMGDVCSLTLNDDNMDWKFPSRNPLSLNISMF
jgi:hypothetical protein